MGEFDPPDMNPYLDIPLSVVQSEAHRQLALKAAIESLVLLKNDGLLPLTSTVNKLAVNEYFFLVIPIIIFKDFKHEIYRCKAYKELQQFLVLWSET